MGGGKPWEGGRAHLLSEALSNYVPMVQFEVDFMGLYLVLDLRCKPVYAWYASVRIYIRLGVRVRVCKQQFQQVCLFQHTPTHVCVFVCAPGIAYFPSHGAQA